MKYFTPELVVAYGSDDPATWKDAEARWDDACARYDAYLASVKDRLPADLRHVEDTYRLHDAVVRVMGRRRQEFLLLLQPASPPQPLLTFIYELVGEPVIRKDVLPPDYQSTGGVLTSYGLAGAPEAEESSTEEGSSEREDSIQTEEGDGG